MQATKAHAVAWPDVREQVVEHQKNYSSFTLGAWRKWNVRY